MENKSLDVIPMMEPDRQYYFINRCKTYVKDLAQTLGRTPTYCVTTFGCQICNNEILK